MGSSQLEIAHSAPITYAVHYRSEGKLRSPRSNSLASWVSTSGCIALLRARAPSASAPCHFAESRICVQERAEFIDSNRVLAGAAALMTLCCAEVAPAVLHNGAIEAKIQRSHRTISLRHFRSVQIES